MVVNKPKRRSPYILKSTFDLNYDPRVTDTNRCPVTYDNTKSSKSAIDLIKMGRPLWSAYPYNNIMGIVIYKLAPMERRSKN